MLQIGTAQDTDEGDDSEDQNQHVESDSATTAQDIDGDDSENQDQHVDSGSVTATEEEDEESVHTTDGSAL